MKIWKQKKKMEEEIRRRFRFLSYAPIIAVSAKTGRSIERLKDKIIEIFNNYTQRIPTSKLIELLKKQLLDIHFQVQMVYLRIYYTTQFDTRPPRIALVMNKPNLLHFTYKRYLINYLRDNFNFEGTPIHVIARGKHDKMGDEEYLEREINKLILGVSLNRVKMIFCWCYSAVVALPLALAFGVASGAGAIAGLYGAIILGFLQLFLEELNSNFRSNRTYDGCSCCNSYFPK